MIYTLTLNPALDKQLTVPEITPDTVLRATETKTDLGGKGFNISRMLQSLGSESTAIAFLGGYTGTQMEAGLTALGIQSEIIRVEGETRTNVSIVDANYSRYIKVNEAGPIISQEARDQLISLLSQRATPGTWWTLSGSLPPGLPMDFYGTLTTLLTERGAKVIVDASGSALLAALQGGPFLVKPNQAELAALSESILKTPQAITAAAQKLCEMGAQNVVVSLGKEGAIVLSEECSQQIATPDISEKNPIGAGDSMVAGIVQKLAVGASLSEAVRWGVACGAATASQPGTTVGRLEQVELLFSKVSLASHRSS